MRNFLCFLCSVPVPLCTTFSCVVAPLDKFENKPVLVVTGGKSAKLQNPESTVAERQNPSVAEQAPASLPRTASPLPAVGLAGLLFLMLGLGLPLLRRQ